MLTVELREADKASSELAEVEIFCDSEDLETLMRQLEFLKKGSTHVHLNTPSWAGDELNEKTVGEGNVLIHHLRIAMVPPI
jgi:hypothetical protein